MSISIERPKAIFQRIGAWLTPLKFPPVQASGVSSMSPVSLASRRGHFSTLDELTGCIRASMLVPGLAGPLLSVPERRRQRQQRVSLMPDSVPSLPQQTKDRVIFWRRGGSEEDGRQPERGNRAVAAAAAAVVLGGGGLTVEVGGSDEGTAGGDDATELLVDAMVFEPLPYR